MNECIDCGKPTELICVKCIDNCCEKCTDAGFYCRTCSRNQRADRRNARLQNAERVEKELGQ